MEIYDYKRMKELGLAELKKLDSNMGFEIIFSHWHPTDSGKKVSYQSVIIQQAEIATLSTSKTGDIDKEAKDRKDSLALLVGDIDKIVNPK